MQAPSGILHNSIHCLSWLTSTRPPRPCRQAPAESPRRPSATSAAPCGAPRPHTLLGSESGPCPAFDRITPGDVVNGIKDALMEGEKQLALLEATVEPTWGGLVEPLEKLHDPIDRAWGTSQHLLSVKDSQGLRDAVQEVEPVVVKL